MCDLTAIILTKNESKNIEKCINSIKLIAKRIVVVDSFSEDNTVKISEELGADVYQHVFINHAEQFNWALDNTNIETEWVLKIDADEEFTEQLSMEIEKTLDSLDNYITGITINLRIYFMGKWIKHGGMYPLKLLRIFRVKAGRMEEKNMDEHIKLKYGRVISLKNDFIHNDYKNLVYWIKKHNWYSNKEVIDYFERNDNENKFSANELSNNQAKRKRIYKNNLYYGIMPSFFRAKIYYIYRYYIKLGFLDGREGKIFHFLQAYWYRFLVDSKIYEFEKTGNRIENQGDLK